MKALMICGGAANQRNLAHLLHAILPLSHIARISVPPVPAKLSRRLVSISAGLPLRQAWSRMLTHYERLHPSFPSVPVSDHRGVNARSVLELVRREQPDLVLVSGTDLLKPPLIEAIAKGGRAMNLHTGLSPYLKGAPNCTNLALALGEFGLIGNTVMWLDSGIDSGDIIATERTRLTGSESLGELHVKVMEHGNDLYARCVERLFTGLPLPSVPQRALGPGRLFMSSDWTGAMIARAVTNFYLGYRPEAVRSAPSVRLVPLGGEKLIATE